MKIAGQEAITIISERYGLNPYDAWAKIKSWIATAEIEAWITLKDHPESFRPEWVHRILTSSGSRQGAPSKWDLPQPSRVDGTEHVLFFEPAILGCDGGRYSCGRDLVVSGSLIHQASVTSGELGQVAVNITSMRTHPLIVPSEGTPGVTLAKQAHGLLVADEGNHHDTKPKNRKRYAEELSLWMARKGVRVLQRMSVEDIAKAFSNYIREERTDKTGLLPSRPRDMEGEVNRIRKNMAAEKQIQESTSG